LAKFVVFAEFLRFLQQVESAVHVLLLQVVDSEDVANLTKLFA
jgi:hypothetical protein